MERMNRDEMDHILAHARFGHIGFARGGRAYLIPIYFGYDGTNCYFQSHPGRKDEFIEATSEACLAVSLVGSSDRWQSILLFGPVERITTPHDRLIAEDVLMPVPRPPEMGFDAAGQPRRTGKRTYLWRLRVHRMTGRRSVSAVPEEDVATA